MKYRLIINSKVIRETYVQENPGDWHSEIEEFKNDMIDYFDIDYDEYYKNISDYFEANNVGLSTIYRNKFIEIRRV